MEPATTRRAGNRGNRPQDHEQQLAALGIRLQQTTQQIRTPEDWARCLRIAARLPGQTWANILLISAQRPGATTLKGYEEWRTAGRQVIRNEPGIQLFGASRVTYAWDLSQTTGRPLPSPPTLRSAETPPSLWDSLCWLARREGFAVEREHGCPDDGVTLWTARRIRILPDITSGEAVWALAHQLAHVLLHNTIAHPPGTTTSGCGGVLKAEADSVAFITCTRHGVPAEHTLSSPQTWAGSDPRANPAATILAIGERITSTAEKISHVLSRDPPAGSTAPRITTPSQPPAHDTRIEAVLLDAERFYTRQLPASWAPAYLRQRGITTAATHEWHIGYAPRGWTTLTDHLRHHGHQDDTIQAAGLAHPSSRGTLIDHFRDRVMLPVYNDHGNLTGFIGRARPGAAPAVPKYLNSPATSTYQKGGLLFGLHVRDRLAHGATPVIVEGPFDAISVTLADPDHYVGLAPCGTALTTRQAAALSRVADLRRTSILVAFDDDPAGRKAAVRAYGILRTISDRLQSVALPGKDPAEILETEGPVALRTILQDRVRPLSAIVIDAHLATWERRLRDPDGPLLAMRSTASAIADLLPPDAAKAIRQLTGNQELTVIDEHMRPVANPVLTKITRAVPADTAYQISHVAERLAFTDYSDILAEVTNAVVRKASHTSHAAPPQIAKRSFPHTPLTRVPQMTLKLGTRKPGLSWEDKSAHGRSACN